jgi:hypothetical protein
MSALPFILFDDQTGAYNVQDQACDFLQSLKGPIGAISIAGKYRTGKSLFLNRFLLDEKPGEGFHVGSSINACTKGIWIYSKPIVCKLSNGEEFNVVVMDSEGIGSLDANSTHDCRIFSLALLLSSFFVYNSVGSIDDSALKTLSLVTNISKQIRIQSDQEPTREELSQLFPTFCWVVRDFTLLLETPDGKKIDSDTYLENALTQNTSSSDDGVREVISDCFLDRTCVTLVRPCQEESDLQNLDNMPEDQLRPSFVSQMHQVRDMIRHKVKLKKYMGNSVSGRMFTVMARSFTDAINKGAAPVIKDAWTLIADIQYRETLDDAWETFEQLLTTSKSTSSDRLIPHYEGFNLFLQKCFQTALIQFRDNVMDKKRDESTLVDRMNARCSKEKVDHRELVETCMEKAVDMVNSRLDDGEVNTVDELHKMVSKITVQLFKSVCSSNQLVDIWSRVQLPHFWKWVKRVANSQWEDLVSQRRTVENLKTLDNERKGKIKILEHQLQTTKVKHRQQMTEAVSKLEKSTIKNIQQRDEESNRLRQQIMDLTQDFNAKLKDVEQKNKSCSAELETASAQFQASTQECGELSSIVEELNRSSVLDGSLNLQIDDLKSKLDAIQTTNAQLKQQNLESEQQFKAFTTDMTRTSVHTIQELNETNRLEKLRFKQLEDQNELFQTNFAKLQDESKTLRVQIEHTAQKQLSKISELEHGHRVRTEELQEQYLAYVNTSETDRKMHTVKLETLENTNCKLRDEYKKLQDKHMQQNLTAATNSRQLETQLMCLDVDLKNSKRRLTEIDADQGVRKRIKLDFHRIQSEMEKHKSVAEWLEKDKSMKERHIMDLNKTVSQLEKKCTDAERRCDMELLKMQMSITNTNNTNLNK